MWYYIRSYINFILHSRTRHGIHSPFVYELVTNCFHDKSKFEEYSKLRTIRKEFSTNKKVIEIEDLGGGSRVFRSNRRTISSIAKNAGITRKRQKLLFRLIRYFKATSILELGTSLGMATSAMSLANPSSSIQTVEGCPATASIAKQMYNGHDLNNIDLNISSFDDYFNRIKGQDMVFDLIYLDGDHSKDSTLRYFNILLDHIGNQTVFVLDDIHWSPEMEQAWIEITERPEVTVSIDTYNWGLLFFRKEQRKQHFRIRL